MSAPRPQLDCASPNSLRLPSSFLWFLLGAGLSNTGSFMQVVAEGWLVAELSPEPFWSGFVGLCGGLPLLLFLMLSGTVADIIDRRKILIVAQLLLLGIAVALGLLTKLGLITVGWIALLAFLTGIGLAMSHPAYSSFLFDIVGKDVVGKAISLNSIQLHLSRMIGPAIAGVLIASVGAWLCFLINGLSFLLVIPLIFVIPTKVKQPTREFSLQSFLRDLKDTFSYIQNKPKIRLAMLVTALTTAMIMPHIILMPLYAKHYLGVGADVLGWLWVASAVGSVVSNAWFGTFGTTNSKHHLSLLIGFSGLSGVSLAGLALGNQLVTTFVFMFFVGAFLSLTVVVAQTILQLHVDPNYRGRVMGVWGTCFHGMFPVGNFLVGVLAQGLTIPGAWYLTSGVVILFSALYGFRTVFSGKA